MSKKQKITSGEVIAIQGDRIVFQFYWPSDDVGMDFEKLITAEFLTENSSDSIAKLRNAHFYRKRGKKGHELVILYLD